MKKTSFADALDRCLDAVLSGEKTVDQAVSAYPQFAEELRGELEAALWLDQRRAAVAPRPNFLQSNRTYLLDQIRAQNASPAPQKAARSPWKLVPRFAFVFLLAVVMIFSTARIAAASESALPGDGLYPVKLAMENLRLAVTVDWEKEIALRMKHAQSRIDEAETRLDQGRGEELTPALENYQGHIQQVKSLLQDLQDSKPDRARVLKADFEHAKEEHALRLAAMRDSVPPDIASLIEAIEADLQSEDEDVGALSPTPTPTITLTQPASQIPQPTDEQTPVISQTPTDQNDPQGVHPLLDKDGDIGAGEDSWDDDDQDQGDDQGQDGNPQDDRDGDPDDGNAGIGDDGDGGGNPQDDQDGDPNDGDDGGRGQDGNW